jgi:hypothetical protein
LRKKKHHFKKHLLLEGGGPSQPQNMSSKKKKYYVQLVELRKELHKAKDSYNKNKVQAVRVEIKEVGDKIHKTILGADSHSVRKAINTESKMESDQLINTLLKHLE